MLHEPGRNCCQCWEAKGEATRHGERQEQVTVQHVDHGDKEEEEEEEEVSRAREGERDGIWYFPSPPLFTQ